MTAAVRKLKSRLKHGSPAVVRWGQHRRLPLGERRTNCVEFYPSKRSAERRNFLILTMGYLEPRLGRRMPADNPGPPMPRPALPAGVNFCFARPPIGYVGRADWAMTRGERHCRAKQPAPSNRRASRSRRLGALGVVFGDIGTSPLYTLKTVLDYTGPHPDPAAVLGALSLILWTLFLITTVKYVNFAMRIDNDGEGGIIALMTLLGVKKHQRPLIIAVGPLRRGAHLWRRRDHAGDFGALRARRRGADRADACRPTCCRRRP